MGMKFKWKGAGEIERNLRKVAKNMPQEVTNAVHAEAVAIRDNARALTPVRYGILRDSLEVTVQPAPRNRVVITVGTDVEYAPFLHEDLEAQHEIGDAKFLEAPLDEAASGMARRIARRIDLKKAMK